MGAVNTTYTFTATDTITSTKMNNIIDETTITTDAIIGTTLEVASGKLKVRAQGITSNEMGANSVTTNTIVNNTIPVSKLENPSFTWSSGSNVGGLEIGPNITTDSSFTYIDFHSAFPITDYDTRIARSGGTNGWFTIQNNGSGSISLQSTGGVYFGNANMSNPIGTSPLYSIRAWAVIGLAPTRTLDAAANIASATKIDTTHTQVTFNIGMADTSYVVSGCVKNDAALDFATYDHQTTGFKIRHSTETAGRAVQFMVIR